MIAASSRAGYYGTISNEEQRSVSRRTYAGRSAVDDGRMNLVRVIVLATLSLGRFVGARGQFSEAPNTPNTPSAVRCTPYSVCTRAVSHLLGTRRLVPA